MKTLTLLNSNLFWGIPYNIVEQNKTIMEYIKEFIYIDYTDENPEVSHSTRNEPDKYANDCGCIVIEGYADEVDLVLNKIFPNDKR